MFQNLLLQGTFCLLENKSFFDKKSKPLRLLCSKESDCLRLATKEKAVEVFLVSHNRFVLLGDLLLNSFLDSRSGRSAGTKICRRVTLLFISLG